MSRARRRGTALHAGKRAVVPPSDREAAVSRSEARAPLGRAPFLWPALAIFGVALAIRLVHLWQISDSPFASVLMGDAKGYDSWAREIAAGDWIGREVFYQAPLYPYFMGAIYALFGSDPSTLRVCQAFVGSLSCALVGVAGAQFFSPPAGLLAGLLLALYAPAIFFDALIQKSVLDVFFVCVSLALLGYLAREPAARWPWIALGLAVGCLSLTRENALVLVLVIAFWGCLRARDVPARAGPMLGLFLGGVALVLVPVAGRNYAVSGGFHLTTSQFGPNFYIGNNPVADGTYMSLRFGRGSPEYERLDATELAERALDRRLSPGEVSSYWTEKALGFIKSQPLAWLGLQARKTALLLNATEMLDTESQQSHADYSWPLRLLTPVTHFGILVPLATLGLLLTWSDRRRLWILYAVALTYAVSTIMFFVFARYRYPLVPILLLFASAGLVSLAGVWRPVTGRPTEGRTPNPGRPPVDEAPSLRVGKILCAVFLAAIVANWPMLSTDVMRAITATNLGTAFYEQQRFDEAARWYRRAVDMRPDYVPAYNNLGVTLRAQGRVDEAIAAYQEGLRRRDDYPDLHYNLANALMESGRPEAAAEHLRVASMSLPDAAGVHNNLGKALAEQGQLDAAVGELRLAVDLEPASPKAHRNLGNVLATQGRLDDALTHLRRAVEIAPTDADALYDLGSVLLEAGRAAEAVRSLTEAVRLSPTSPEARNNLGIALAAEGKLAEAVAQWERALELRPGFDDARRNLEMAAKARRHEGSAF